LAVNGQPATPPVARADFTTLDANPTTLPYDVTKAQESVRHWLAWSLVAIFGGTVSFAFLTILVDKAVWSDVKDLFTVALSTESALLGSAIGFYFGSRK